MKLISLNLWGGRAYNELAKFLEREKDGIDIFCFQEVLDYGKGQPDQDAKTAKLLHQTDRYKEITNLYPKLESILTTYNGFLSDPYSAGMERLATFVKKDIKAKVQVLPVHEKLPVVVHGKPFYVSCIMQHVMLVDGNKSYDIANVHGLWQNSSKGDTPERLKQSNEITKILSTFGNLRVLCGDLNLLPDIESIKILEKNMKNLIREHKITNTRSPLYTKELRYADYVFVSDGIRVYDFKVLDEEVSDHLPLLLSFS